MNDLYHQLLRFDGVDYILTESLLLYGVGECFCDFIVYVGIKQGAANVFQRFSHIYFCYLALTFKYLETAFEFFA